MNAAPSLSSKNQIFLPVRDYDLTATLDSGQVFRWRLENNFWNGIVGNNVVRLVQTENGIFAETAASQDNWNWLREFLQTGIDLKKILATFPDDKPMNAAVAACRGLRILRQEPWECLASFILSATKQIVQIRQIIARLCECFGNEICRGDPRPPKFGHANPTLTERRHHSFPTAEKIASLTETQLRNCKMGFRAPNLLAAARQIAEGKLNLENIRRMDYAGAKNELMTLRGVGAKIADCVLLFAYGFNSAFPVDVWIERALRQLYFAGREIAGKKLLEFAAMHFGPHAGYAQQYLFHYMRTKKSSGFNLKF